MSRLDQQDLPIVRGAVEIKSEFCVLAGCQSPHRVNYRQGDLIYTPGDQASEFYYIRQGKVKLAFLDESGRHLTLVLLSAGDVFGEAALIEGQERNLLAQAHEDSCLCSFQRSHFFQCLGRHPQLITWLLATFAKREQQLAEKLSLLAFKKVPVRLAQQLLNLAQQSGEQRPQGIEIRMTHQEIADLIGAVRETTTMMLDRLQSQGITRNGHRSIILLDAARLEQVAAGQSRISDNR